MTPRALSLLAALASPMFLGAAVCGWLLGLWPATPATLAVAAFAVCSGPLLAIFHAASERPAEDEPEPFEPAFVAVPAPVNPAEARARAFHNWRDKDNEVLARRERERRASRYLRT